jgi:Nucleotidyltransferase domain
MSIPEAQLETWSKVGSQTQSTDTYATVRNALDDKNAAYAGSIEIFLQGSYGNDTNVFGKDSDVDIVILCDKAYFRDLSRLSPLELAAYEAAAGGAPSYPFATFKADVIQVLKKKFGADVDTSSKKAVKIKANGNRRSADVLICQEFRRYSKYTGSRDDYTVGVGFRTTDGTLIENYPKFHSTTLTAKHQVTTQWLKPTIRIFKNIRNRLIDDRKLQSGAAPSYYLEGLLWNAPVEAFGTNYNTTVFNCLKWMTEVDESKLICANAMFPLLGDNSPVKWNPANFRAYRSQAISLWNDGSRPRLADRYGSDR